MIKTKRLKNTASEGRNGLPKKYFRKRHTVAVTKNTVILIVLAFALFLEGGGPVSSQFMHYVCG